MYTYFSASILHESIPESFILDLSVIQAYNEYYMLFSGDELQIHDMIMTKPEDIKIALVKHFCDKKNDTDVEMENMDTTEPANQPDISDNMFRHSSLGHPIQQLFTNMLQHSKTTAPPSFEEDENILTILGMLTVHDIKFLNRPTINIFLTAINRSNGDDHSHEYITSLKLSHYH